MKKSSDMNNFPPARGRKVDGGSCSNASGPRADSLENLSRGEILMRKRLQSA